MSHQTLNDYFSFATHPLQLRAFSHIMSDMTTKSVIYRVIDLHWEMHKDSFWHRKCHNSFSYCTQTLPCASKVIVVVNHCNEKHCTKN
jgi:hypothetical protein